MNMMASILYRLGEVHVPSLLLYDRGDGVGKRRLLAVDEGDWNGIVQQYQLCFHGVLCPQVLVAADDGECMFTSKYKNNNKKL